MVFSYGNAGSGENLLFPVSGVGQLSNAKASATIIHSFSCPPFSCQYYCDNKNNQFHHTLSLFYLINGY